MSKYVYILYAARRDLGDSNGAPVIWCAGEKDINLAAIGEEEAGTGHALYRYRVGERRGNTPPRLMYERLVEIFW